jgi:hypothetical protein
MSTATVVATAVTAIATAATKTIMSVSSGIDRRKQCGDSEEFLDERGHLFCCLKKKEIVGRRVISLRNLK